MRNSVAALSLCLVAALRLGSQEHQHPATAAPVALQPMAQQARQLTEALNYLGEPLTDAEQRRVNDAIGMPDEAAAVEALEAVFDSHVLVNIGINAEGRVKVEQGRSKPDLIEEGARLFLVKIVNDAHVTSELNVVSPNSGNVFIRSNGQPDPPITLTPQASKDRWADISLVQQPPMRKRLSGLVHEYQILQIYSRDTGQRSAKISFNVGQGSQDIGFRNDVTILFNVAPTTQITLLVKDEAGLPAMASFVIRDRLNRLYPLPSKRLAPDFFFQPQIYRADGETVRLPAGYYTIQYRGGPESLPHTREVEVNAQGPAELAFQLDRWIDPAKFGWYSGDHHVHAAGCSHYMNPTEGVEPRDMIRQILGERLNIGSVLTWGPDYYYQKQFFSGHDDPLSHPDRLMHYDLEVSGFPSSHAGHIVLLKLNEQDYPNTKRIEDWPTWDLPIFRWAKAQGAITGFAHSGWGLEVKTKDLPTYEMPGFDGIGANEYIVDVTHPGMVDFISTVDTPYVWELNIWYHTLNVGFRTRIAGETDFPCIYDDRVGIGRTYAKLSGELSYGAWLDSLKAGQSYVSDGKTHLMDFEVNHSKVGASNDLRLTAPGKVTVTLKAAAYLPEIPNEQIRGLPYDQKPYWDVERARVSNTREVPVEIIVNGKVLAKKNIFADGKVNDLEFEVPVSESSWIAARVLPSAHTNPIFALIDDRPVRASKRSAQWCLDAVNQCWTQKAPRMALGDLGNAKAAYDHAREVYRRLISESPR